MKLIINCSVNSNYHQTKFEIYRFINVVIQTNSMFLWNNISTVPVAFLQYSISQIKWTWKSLKLKVAKAYNIFKKISAKVWPFSCPCGFTFRLMIPVKYVGDYTTPSFEEIRIPPKRTLSP